MDENKNEKKKETKPKAPSKTKALEKELAELKDAHLRLAAEYDNFRKRTAKEKEELTGYITGETVLKFLPVVDALELAATSEGGSAQDIKKGLEMIRSLAGECLKNAGVTEIETGGGFDPNLHNAVMHVDDENLPENSIAAQLQKGYKLGDRVIRHSMVQVAN